MGSIAKKPKAPKVSGEEKRLKREARERTAEEERRRLADRDAMVRGLRGRRSLLGGSGFAGFADDAGRRLTG